MMIERVDDFEWIEGTENDFKTEGVSKNTSEASENASEAQCCMKRIKKLEGLECLECRRYFTNAWKSICHVRKKRIYS